VSIYGSNPLPDLVREGLEILFVGINPGLKSARVGHYYAGPGNLFWRCLHESGLTPVRLAPDEDRRVLEWGIGITDCVARPTRSAGDVAGAEFRAAAPVLLAKVERFRPRIVCFNGLTGARACFDPAAALGPQDALLGPAHVFVVPSTSAAIAGFTREARVAWFVLLREFRDALSGSG
jgi:TDG/mug DNA glycosylase family protein